MSALVGESAALQEVRKLIELAAPSSASVLITGETGTGKELAALTLHRLSARGDRPFVAVSCAALPEPLIEAELFGHEKGAFTGAHAARIGRFEMADTGTLFLDEIGELSPAIQVKLLRVLQERVIERLGASEPHPVDVRIVAATHRDLEAEVLAGRFRADLYYRLKVLSVHIPPLRERRGDIPLLFRDLAERIRLEEGSRPITAPPRILARLMRHSWPGNVREFENVVRHLVAVSKGPTVQEADLPGPLNQETLIGPSSELVVPGMTLAEVERYAILRTYEALDHNAQATAEALQVSVRTIHYRLRRYREEGVLAERGAERGSPPPSPAQLDPAAESAQEGWARNKPRLLLADDDDDLRWSLASLLEAEGFEVVQVASGTALLEHLGSALLFEQRAAPPDVIVSDVRMPGMTGIQFLEGVRANGWKVPVVLITAFGDPTMREYARSLDAELLEKPLDLNRLQGALKRSLSC